MIEARKSPIDNKFRAWTKLDACSVQSEPRFVNMRGETLPTQFCVAVEDSAEDAIKWAKALLKEKGFTMTKGE